MKKSLVKKAASRMVRILRSLQTIEDKWESRFSYTAVLSLPKNHPRIMTKGTTAVVFDLGVVKTGAFESDSKHFVGKVLYYIEGKEFYGKPIPEDVIYLRGGSSGLYPWDGLPPTIHSLESMGFDVVFHEQFRISIGRDSRFYFTIAPNLCEGGYKVEDADGFDFARLKNGNELREQFEGGVERILSDVEAGKYELEISSHAKEGTSSEAIRRIFFVQYDPTTNKGERLVAGDLDHLVLKHPTFENRKVKELRWRDIVFYSALDLFN